MKTSLFFLPLFALTACGTGNEKEGGVAPRPDTSVATDGGDEDGFVLDDTGTFNTDALVNDTAPEPKITVDPKTCAEAAATKAYVGCDFWPTVVANNVWSIFDYAVVVANASDEEATVEVDGNGITKKTVTVAPQSLAKIYLPWNAALKGADTNSCGTATPLTSSVFAAKGAYHLVASRPVTVYQFNALQYKGAGGETGKDWSTCPGNTTCPSSGGKVGCFSFSNDASLLMPSTAMTGNYRVAGIHGWSSKPLIGAEQDVLGAYVTITATQDNTKVVFKSRGKVLAGGGGTIAATAAGGELTMTMNAGDVAELVGEAKTTADLSGSLVAADKPVQVIVGVPCIQMPIGTQACDHIEESVFPAETLGKEYIVAPPSTPKGTSVGHNVRLYGNRDGTKLTYSNKPAGAPDVINAGQVVTLERVNANFKVTGDNEFAVGTFMFGGSLQDPVFLGASKGDPSMSLVTSIEQFRTKYIFLAPDDYTVSYVDIVHPADAKVVLDGAAPTGAATAIGSTGYSLTRAKLGAGKSGAHTLTSDKPVGIQVMGFGDYTSYHYPGGLDLKTIAPPPPIK